MRWWKFPKPSEFDREIDEELRDHLDRQAADFRAQGVSDAEARRRASLAFGGLESVKEECRDVRRLRLMDSTWQDIRYACRALRRTPAFTIAALLTLALGIGATAAIFSVVNAVLLRPPPYPNPDRIFVLTYPDGGSQDGQIFHYVRERARSFAHLAAHSGSSGWNLVAGEHAEYVKGTPVSESFFDVLGVRPLFGRGFSTTEDQANGPAAVVLSEPLWRRVMGAKPDALGKVVLLGGLPHTIVGVMPAGFRTTPPADLWTPLRLSPRNNSWNYRVLGRLRDGMSPVQATSELGSLKAGMHRDLVGISENRSGALLWMTYQSWLGLGGRDALLLLLGAVAFLLLIACVNVASLQLVRAAGRRREMATRSALGGGRSRLIRQVLTESVVLAVAGAGLGILVAQRGVPTLVRLVPPGLLDDAHAATLDWRVLGVTLALAVIAGILFGLAPALGTARLDLRAALRDGSRNTAGRSTVWLRRMFATLQVAVAVVLLVGAGLLIRTFVNLRNAPLGFDPSDVVIGKMSLQGSTTQSRDQLSAFFERTLARLREAPGVTTAAVGNNVPIESGLNLPLEAPAGALVNEPRAVDWRYVTPEYFQLFGIPLRGGRAFDDRDHAQGAQVAVVNEAFARAYFGNAPVLGRVVQLARSFKDPPREIVGVIADVKSRSASGWTQGSSALGSAAAPTMYVPAAQVPDGILSLVHHYFPVSWAIRGRQHSETVSAVQAVVKSAAPQLPFIRFETMTQVIGRDLEVQRFLMTLLGVFAAVSLALATVGIYGLISYTTSQRTQEVGIRIALGATRRRVLRAFLQEGLSLVAIGVAIGLGGAAIMSGAVSSFVFGVEPLDPVTFAGVSALLIIVAGVATLIPALKAARTDPMRALRLE